MEYPQFTKGQKVRTRYGTIRTVLFQRGCQVFVVEESDGWYHPMKVWPVKHAEAVLAEQEGVQNEH